ncbi:MAG: hypothetical protein ACKO96_03870, partial [Flammeovirgaceae bacterium]
MTANTTAQIATFLNVSPNQIKSVTEMAWVYCVVVRGHRARFVSKKVVKNEKVTTMDFVTAFNQEFGTEAKLWQKQGITRIYLNDKKLPSYFEVKNGAVQPHRAASAEMKAFIKANAHLEVCAAAPNAKAQSFREQMIHATSQPDSIQDSWKAYHK